MTSVAAPDRTISTAGGTLRFTCCDGVRAPIGPSPSFNALRLGDGDVREVSWPSVLSDG
jgi:hypothetical protein